MVSYLAMTVVAERVEIVHLKTEVGNIHSEAEKLQGVVTGKRPLASFVVPANFFNVAAVRLDNS